MDEDSALQGVPALGGQHYASRLGTQDPSNCLCQLGLLTTIPVIFCRMYHKQTWWGVPSYRYLTSLLYPSSNCLIHFPVGIRCPHIRNFQAWYSSYPSWFRYWQQARHHSLHVMQMQLCMMRMMEWLRTRLHRWFPDHLHCRLRSSHHSLLLHRCRSCQLYKLQLIQRLLKWLHHQQQRQLLLQHQYLRHSRRHLRHPLSLQRWRNCQPGRYLWVLLLSLQLQDCLLTKKTDWINLLVSETEGEPIGDLLGHGPDPHCWACLLTIEDRPSEDVLWGLRRSSSPRRKSPESAVRTRRSSPTHKRHRSTSYERFQSPRNERLRDLRRSGSWDRRSRSRYLIRRSRISEGRRRSKCWSRSRSRSPHKSRTGFRGTDSRHRLDSSRRGPKSVVGDEVDFKDRVFKDIYHDFRDAIRC